MGALLASSAMDIPTNNIKMLATAHPHTYCLDQVGSNDNDKRRTMELAPPFGMAYTRTLAMLGSRPMILKAIPKVSLELV